MRHADLERDAAICQAMAADLEAYLLKDVVYWSLSDPGPRRSPYPQLTLGGLLMRLHHLGVLSRELTPSTYESYARAREKVEAVLESWRVRFERKLLTELPARIRSWSSFLADCAETPGACVDEYPTQAEVRTMIAVLFEHAQAVRGLSQVYAPIHGLDRRLQNLTLPHPFIWDPVFQPAYPRAPYWWLYASPSGR